MIAVIAVVGGDDEVAAARQALVDATAGLAFFAGQTVESWTAPTGRTGVAWVRSVGVHSSPESTWVSPQRVGFVLGQPIRWVGGRADGLGVLDAERMVAHDPERLAEELDGRGLVMTVHGDGVDIVADPLQSYPVYALERPRAASRWVTNFPGALRQPGPAASTLVAGRIATAVAYGSSFDGAPWLVGAHRLASWAARTAVPGGLHVYSAAPRLDRLVGLHGRGDIHPASAGAVLVEITRAMALRHDADLIVPVSAGKDSRLILAAALAGELPVRAVTGGAQDSADVVVGRALAEASGVEHQRISDTQATRTTAPLETIDLVSRVSAGVVTAGDAHFFPHGPSEISGTWLSGQAGEIARAFYGRPRGPATTALVLGKAMSRRPGRPTPLTPVAEARVAWEVRRRLHGLLRAGAGPSSLGDAFYLTDRMGRHIAGALLHFELGLDYASPLWSRRLLPYLWAGTGAQRQRSTFHDEVTTALVAGQPKATRRAFEDAIRGRGPGAGEEAPVEPGGFADDALRQAQTALHEMATAMPAADPLWRSLSRRRTLALAERAGADLDFIERQHVWRLATALRSWTG